MLIIGVNKSVCQTVDFTYSVNSNQLCSPATIKFTSHSSRIAKGYLWDFGNNTRSILSNPEIVYNNAGTYKVRLLVLYENNIKEISKNIIIKSITPIVLTADRDQLCATSGIQFTASANSPITNYQWDFGDSTALQNSNTSSIAHTYPNFGEYTSSVICTSPNGCKSFSSKLIKIKEPIITGSFNKGSGCIPVVNSFNSVITIPSTSIVNSCVWDMGDGNIINNISFNQDHTYSSPGNYYPKLTITTVDGCTKTFNFNEVYYGTPPTNLIAYPVKTIWCGSETTRFVAKSDNADHYDWNFGNGSIITTADTVIQHRFTSLGTKNVSVTPRYNNCVGATQTIQIQVIGALAGFSFQNNCNDKKTFNLRNNSSGSNLNFLWNFGDQSSVSNQRNLTHTYPEIGLFNAILIASDPLSGCKDTAKAIIETIKPNLINPNNSICINTSTTFSLINGYHNNTVTFLWNIMGNQLGRNHDSIKGIIATDLGSFTNKVIINNGQGYCRDTIYLTHPIIVTGPKLDFNTENSFCLSKPLSITNLSSPYLSTDTIIKFYWNYGDGANNIESITSPLHQYSAQGTYNVKLIGLDNKGCRDSLVKAITVRPMPFLFIIPRNDTICLGSSKTIIAYTSDSVLWSSPITNYNFCNTCDTNIISPAHTTMYYATSTNIYNCKSTDSAFVKIYEPFTANALINDISICEHNSAALNASPLDKEIIWTPSSGLNNSNNYNPTASPNQSTIYVAKLTDSAGCFSSTAEINVRINPSPIVELGSNKLVPYNSIFTFNPGYSSNVVRYEWTPANALSCSNCAYPQTTVNDLKSFTIKVTSDSGCISTDNVILAIECNNAYLMMPGAFTPNNDGLNDIYYPLANGIKRIKRFAIYNKNSQLLFEQKEFLPNNKSYGWDGKYLNSRQPIGAYVYIIEAVCELEQTTVKKGSFMLLN